jgi:hypothetical protein
VVEQHQQLSREGKGLRAMDLKLLLIALAMVAVGGFILWRFRKSNFKEKIGPGCLMAFGLLLVGIGLLSALFSIGFKS